MTITASQADFSYSVYQVGQAAAELLEAGADVQSVLLETMAKVLGDRQDEVLEANTLDLEASLEMAVPELVLDWLKLTPERLQTSLKILRRLASLGDPRVLTHQPISHITKAVAGFSQVVPLGVIALVYEAFPELAVIMAGLCIRTGNGLILKGGNEASQTNQVIINALHQALDQVNLPRHCVLYLSAEHGDATRSWLMQDEGVDLLIPYGRPNLVQQVVRQAAVPVLPPAMGNCYLYWSASGKLDTVAQMVLDSHRGEPDAVNSIEKVLIHEHCSMAAVNQLCHQLWEQGFEIQGGPIFTEHIPELTPVEEPNWGRPFLNKTVALRQVNGPETAAHLINRCSSGHADGLVTESYRESLLFSRLVESAVIYVNQSPRFSRNPTQATAIALGMTAQRGRCAGFIGLNALMTTQHILQGRG